jgi:nucleoside-diphosphate-sugar epimerase
MGATTESSRGRLRVVALVAEFSTARRVSQPSAVIGAGWADATDSLRRALDRILVTGGTGFIGRSSLPALTEIGAELHLVSREPRSVAEAPGAVVHAADLLAPGAAAELIDAVRPSHLLHLAWYVEPGQVWSAPENRRWVEVTAELAAAFAGVGGQRLVFGGSVSQYGYPDDGVCFEDAPQRPVDLYGTCKAEAEELALATCASAGISAASARIFFAFGPYEHPRRLVSSVARSLLRGEPARCSHGRQRRDYLYSPDIGDALARLLGGDLEGPVNVGSGEALALRELVAMVARATGNADLVEFGAIEPGPNEAPLLVADVTRLRDELGWVPPHRPEDAAALTVDWWRSALSG